jgi:hypothetical protein
MQTLKTKLSQLIHNIYIEHKVATLQRGIADYTKDKLQLGEAFLKEAREAAAAMVQQELPNRNDKENAMLLDYLQGLMEVRFKEMVVGEAVVKLGYAGWASGELIDQLAKELASILKEKQTVSNPNDLFPIPERK